MGGGKGVEREGGVGRVVRDGEGGGVKWGESGGGGGDGGGVCVCVRVCVCGGDSIRYDMSVGRLRYEMR